MNDSRLRVVLWSGALIAGGVVLLLFNLGVLAAYGRWPQLVLAAVCGTAAAGFFITFARDHQEWWRLLPAWTLTALATMSLTAMLPDVDRALIAAQVFAGLALAFANIYLLARRERWWAILPGGFMLVLAVVVGVSTRIPTTEVLAAILFIGLGLVFFLLYLLGDKRRQWWAMIPGSVLLVFGIFALTAGRTEVYPLLRWWPVALVVLGMILPFTLRPSAPPDKLEVNHARPAKAAAPPARAPAQASTNASIKPTGKPGFTAEARPSPAPPAPRPSFGEYTQPAPGASVEILPDE